MDDGRVVRITQLTIWALCSLRPFLPCCSVPISKLPQLIYETQKDMDHSGVFYSVVGHAGDGG